MEQIIAQLVGGALGGAGGGTGKLFIFSDDKSHGASIKYSWWSNSECEIKDQT